MSEIEIDEERVRENELKMKTLIRFLDRAPSGFEADVEYDGGRAYINAHVDERIGRFGYVSGFDVITVDFNEKRIKFAPDRKTWKEIKDI